MSKAILISNPKQLQVIAYSLALLENDLPTDAQKDARTVLARLQKRGIWGHIED